MPVFEPNQPIETKEPVIVVENRLAPGFYRFELVVVDDEGESSAPDVAIVEVVGDPTG